MKKYTIKKLSQSPALRLELYEWMLEEWRKPVDFSYDNCTSYGFCYQLFQMQEINLMRKFKKVLPELYANRKRRILRKNDYHYSHTGDHPQGRLDRQNALEKAIEEVKINQL